MNVPSDSTWYLTDRLGSVRDVVNATGNLVNHVEYSSFGQVVSQTNPAAGDRFLFTGREFDAELGLYYYRARYYDPSLGRFISEDWFEPTTNLSCLFEALEKINPYRYAQNNPLMYTDPTGHVTVVEYDFTQKGTLKPTIAGSGICNIVHVVGIGITIFTFYSLQPGCVAACIALRAASAAAAAQMLPPMIAHTACFFNGIPF